MFLRNSNILINRFSEIFQRFSQQFFKNMQTNYSSTNLNEKRNNPFVTLPSPVKSPSDKKEYKVIKLENGLVACLIADSAPLNSFEDSSSEEDSDLEESDSNKESENSEVQSENESDGATDDSPMKKVSEVEQKMAAAALCVNVGSFSDPKEIPGLAHFLEHMVFMGSSKYPGENEFDSFIKRKGGSDNASTDCETTVFYFECLEKHLFKSLDRFAQFFISPLMKESAMTREREAIESEFQMALPKDSYRKEQLLSSLAYPDCPVSTFSWGNLITLQENVDDTKLYADVHEFRRKHYSAHRMTLAIQARLSMEELQNLVLECFSNVPNNSLPQNSFKKYENNVFDPLKFHKIYYVKPQKDICQLDLKWCLPSLLDKYRTKPHQYVSWLIGDEGKGSLLSYLKKKVWALAIFTGNGETGIENNSMYSFFSVSIVLTTGGLSNLTNVITAVFSYINMLRDVGPQERIFKEIQTIEDVSFRFSVEEDPIDYVEEIAEAMHFYRPEDFITGSELYFEYKPEEIKMVIDNLVPKKMNVIVMNANDKEEINYDKKEEWFGTLYTDAEIPNEWIKNWENAPIFPDMKLPPPNPFLTNNFDILPEDPNNPEYPEKIRDDSLFELWYKKDQKFKLPIAYYNIYLISPFAVESPLSACKMDIFMNLLIIQMAEDIYPAQVAELLYSVNMNDRGLVFKISGYNEKLPILLDLISKHLSKVATEMTSSIFDAVKEKLTNGYYNRFIKPSALNKDIRLSLLMDKYYASTEKFSVISSVTYEDMKRFCNNFLTKLYIKALVQGNVDRETALGVLQNFVQTLEYSPLDKILYPRFQVWNLPKGEKCCRIQSFNENDSNSIVTNYYQHGPFNIKHSVILELIMMIIEEPLFDNLRTKEQLGYHVFCSFRDTFGILGYTITVNAQATKNTTAYVDERIENFVKYMTKMFKKMSEKKLNQIKRDLIKTKQRADVVLQEEVYRNWSEIVGDDYMFDRLKKEIAAIETIKMADLRKFWENINVSGNPEKSRKLTVQVVGYNTKVTDGGPSKSSICKTEEFPFDNAMRKRPVMAFLSSVENLKRLDGYFICDLVETKKNMKYYPPSPNQMK